MTHPAALLVAGLVVCCLIDSFIGYMSKFRKVIRVRR
jgi:hypothetical protein